MEEKDMSKHAKIDKNNKKRRGLV